MKKHIIKINSVNETNKFIFESSNHPTEYTVVDIYSILEGGTPIDPETGDDLVFIGETTDYIQCGTYSSKRLDIMFDKENSTSGK
jgi:hypothetical protein